MTDASLDRPLAAAAYFAGFVGLYVVGPLGLLIWKRRDSAFVSFHAAQALLLNVVMVPLMIVSFWLSEAIFGLLMLMTLVVLVGAGISVLRGRGWRLPILAPMADQIAARG